MGILKRLRTKLGLVHPQSPSPGQSVWAKWYSGKEFSADWASWNFPIWNTYLKDLKTTAKPLVILEIGSWEGRSAIFFLEAFERSTITCIDTFEGGQDDYGGSSVHFPMIESRFDANLSTYPGRVRKMKSTSAKALTVLGDEGARFDLIYIDGAHDRDSVHVDSLLAWPLLKDGGIVIWDDYTWGGGQTAIDKRPEEAINLFVASRRGGIRLLHRDGQLIARKVDGGTQRFGARSFLTERALRALHIKTLGKVH